jgi:hypothetical protein
VTVSLVRHGVSLVRHGVNLSVSAIRWTSVDGHRLEGGADTDETVGNEIGSADAFVGILSDRSMRSKYVLIELGARWGLNKHLLPLLAPQTPASVLGGPLTGKNALQADSDEPRTSKLQLVVDGERCFIRDEAKLPTAIRCLTAPQRD